MISAVPALVQFTLCQYFIVHLHFIFAEEITLCPVVGTTSLIHSVYTFMRNQELYRLHFTQDIQWFCIFCYSNNATYREFNPGMRDSGCFFN